MMSPQHSPSRDSELMTDNARGRRRDDSSHEQATSRGWRQRLRTGFRRCDPDELEQNLVRLTNITILFTYGWIYTEINGIDNRLWKMLLAAFLSFTLAVFVWMYRVPARLPARIIATTVADRAVISFVLAVYGPWAAFISYLYPWCDIGNSARYGRIYGLPSTALSLIGFSIVIYVNEYWHSPEVIPVAAGMWLCILFSPLYSGVFYRRLRQASEKLRELATHDPLTRLPNRPFLYERLNQAIALAERHHRRFVVMFIDLDNFKRINDSGGHDAGDQALCETAAALRQAVRQGDTVARLGGDEFVVLLHDVHCQTVSNLRNVADNMRDVLNTNTRAHLS